MDRMGAHLRKLGRNIPVSVHDAAPYDGDVLYFLCMDQAPAGEVLLPRAGQQHCPGLQMKRNVVSQLDRSGKKCATGQDNRSATHFRTSVDRLLNGDSVQCLTVASRPKIAHVERIRSEWHFSRDYRSGKGNSTDS
jgi:hypothetical protein